MKKLRKLQKGLAMLLILAIVAGLVPDMSGGANKVQSATGTGTEPSVSAYATKEQLMTAFNPDANGTATTTGKLVFGKNENRTSQQWYILGKDNGVSGDNTIIFAASPIATWKAFSSSTSNKIFDPSFGVYASNPSEVYPNHYGASVLRVALQNMATSETYFTTAEQGLMNPTTVTTKDTKNSATYTTTDKLYALAADGNGSSYTTIKAGTSDSTVLAMSSYWRSGDRFWLRSPIDNSESRALLAYPGYYVGYSNVRNDYAVQPASNLNLSSVLFASAATAASSDTVSNTIASETAMTLRFDGSSENIGTVTYNTTTGDIKATNGSTEGEVALVVQGKDGTNNWYYSKKIDTSETIHVSAIEAESNTPASIDLSTCKIWLEITDKDGMIYAANADKEIEKINTTYVTKEQLMNSFKPYSDGTAVNTGKLVFGKKSDGTTAQEWYILGKDGDVLGDNTIIFAASPIATNQVFENDYSNNKDFQSSFGVYASNPSEVYPNHYGASDLRVALQGMATNTSYFTTAEQGLMNATTVKTKDTNNSSVTYTTTDKLYALQGNYHDKKLWAGTSDSTVLARSSYWSNGDKFWLRSPYDDIAIGALLASPGRYVYGSYVDDGNAVQPASNLNLSSVLFASAATAASSDTVSGTLTDGTAMTLRLNGTGKDIGTVTYDTTTGDIKVAKGSTSQTVALIVQGNDEINNWYFSKKIDAAETVNASAINSALSLSSDIDLSGCKIWLEITDTDGMIYAVGVTEVLSITSVEITGIDTPVSNTALDTEASCVTTGVSSTTPSVKWTPSGSTAGYNTSYTASITLTADTGYEFTDSTTATVLGNSATSVAKNDDGTLTVTYAFPATAKDKLTSITPPQAITIANGTAYSAMNLPAKVNIVTEGNTVTSAPVTWNTTTPASGSYDPAVLTQQTVTLNGTVVCPDSIDANGVSLTTIITITISAAGIVGAPTANPTAGTYSKNQSVALSSSTEGATIYYTTDGSEPTITGGTTKQYTEPILVTGTEGQSITTTIKAIAVKNGMKDSSVETFTYTIHQIPVAKYTYATKTQLMDGTFAPITDGTAVNIGKLVFGKNSSGNPQEWYILGKDESVSGDNTIIFAANPIEKQVFEDDCKNNKTESSLWSDCDYSGVRITEVCPNHYGASDLRVALKGMATNISYFTTAEQGLMNATTVTTYDKNNRVTYTTTDNLYALQGDYQKDKLWAGTSDSTVLARSSYWSNGSTFWLRSPYGRSDDSALLAIPGDYVRDLDVDCYHAVQPASNLNLSSVLFASSAKAASSDTAEAGPIAEGTAMTLRLNGTGKNIGTVTYNTTTGDIKATKGSTEGDVALVVQGKDGTNDWYYSKKITGTEVVNVTDIVSESNTPASIDLSTCKIWLEIKDTDGMIYAVGAAAIPDAPHIEHVDSNNDNICDSCGKYMDNIGARLAGHSLTLDGSVGVNFYMELSSEVISDGSAYMEFTLPGGKTSIVNVSDANTEVISGKTYYKFRCQVNAAEMTDTITAQLRSTVGNSKVYEYTVKEYADYLFAHKEDNAEFAKAAALIEAMVNYGSYAQIYAGYNADNLAVGDKGNLKSVANVTIGEYTYTPNANVTKVQFAGANLSLLSTTTLRMYFRLSDVDVENVTFTYGGNTLEKTQSGDYYYVELVGIPASKLDDDCVVTVNDGTNSFDVTYTPMAYCANVINRETTETRTESLKNLIKALVLYNRAADAYIGNTNNGNQ